MQSRQQGSVVHSVGCHQQPFPLLPLTIISHHPYHHDPTLVNSKRKIQLIRSIWAVNLSIFQHWAMLATLGNLVCFEIFIQK